MKKGRLFRKSDVMPRVETEAREMDSVAAYRGDRRRVFHILMEARHYWDCMDRYRKERDRNKKYCYGDQWSDIIEVDGKAIREDEYIFKQGNVPLKNNLVRRLVRNVIGVYRSQVKEPTCYARDRAEQKLGETMSTILQCNMQLNRMNLLYPRSLEEFLIGGFVIHRKSYGWRNERMDCWTDCVNPNNFFVDNNMRDYRGWDVSVCGEVHDIPFGTLCGQFAKTPEDYTRFRDIYRTAADRNTIMGFAERFGYSRLENYDFLCNTDPTLCRVIEVWRKEHKPRYRCHDTNTGERFKVDIEDYAELVEQPNANRIAQAVESGMDQSEVPLIEAEWFMDEYWYYYYLTPFGDVLAEGETPYEHKGHPYVFIAYPFIDGEIHSFVGDFIDQQRYVNRLITLYDFIMRASAKGVLLFPEGCEPEGMSMEDVAEEWGRFDGIVYYKPKPGVPMPQQIANNSTQIGIYELLSMQLKLMEDISGVNGALQGKPGYAGQSAALYNQQTQNATTSLLDILDTFSDFVKDGALKDVKNIQQFYDDKMRFNIAGKNAWVEYDPASVRDVDFDLNIAETSNTPVYRQMTNEMLMQLWQAQAITVEQLLEHGSFPFADDLLQSIRSQKEEMEQGAMPQGTDPQAAAQIVQQANPVQTERARRLLQN